MSSHSGPRYYHPTPLCPECKHPTHEGRCPETVDIKQPPHDTFQRDGAMRHQCPCYGGEEA